MPDSLTNGDSNRRPVSHTLNQSQKCDTGKSLKTNGPQSQKLRQTDNNERDRPDGEALSLPSSVAGSGALDRLVETARDYARAAASENTLKAYAKDWAHFTRWCRMKGTEPLPP